jgi:hypothetical protein
MTEDEDYEEQNFVLLLNINVYQVNDDHDFYEDHLMIQNSMYHHQDYSKTRKNDKEKSSILIYLMA